MTSSVNRFTAIDEKEYTGNPCCVLSPFWASIYGVIAKSVKIKTNDLLHCVSNSVIVIFGKSIFPIKLVHTI